MKISTEVIRYRTVADCVEIWKKATPKEQEQIKGFLESGSKNPHGSWGLTYFTNLNTGKKGLTAWATTDGHERGLCLNDLRRIVGLPSVEGGDYRVPRSDDDGERGDDQPNTGSPQPAPGTKAKAGPVKGAKGSPRKPVVQVNNPSPVPPKPSSASPRKLTGGAKQPKKKGK
jgi:hypothetical protein